MTEFEHEVSSFLRSVTRDILELHDGDYGPSEVADAQAKALLKYYKVQNRICRHCGLSIRKGEALVDWEWIHLNGFYRCAGDPHNKAEPK